MASTVIFIYQKGQRVFFFLLGSLWIVGPAELHTWAGGHVPTRLGEKD